MQVEVARLGTDCFGQDGKKMVPETLTGAENLNPNLSKQENPTGVKGEGLTVFKVKVERLNASSSFR